MNRLDNAGTKLIWSANASFLDEDGPHSQAVGFFSKEEDAVRWAKWATRMANETFTEEFNKRMADRRISNAYSDTLRWLHKRLGIQEAQYRTKFDVAAIEIDKLNCLGLNEKEEDL